jgi:hypothetical protein
MNNITKPIATTKNRTERKSNVMSFPVLKAKKDLINVYHANKERKRKLSLFDIA